MEAQRVGQRQIDAARGEIGLHQRCFSRPDARQIASANALRLRASASSVFFVGDAIFALVSPAQRPRSRRMAMKMSR